MWIESITTGEKYGCMIMDNLSNIYEQCIYPKSCQRHHEFLHIFEINECITVYISGWGEPYICMIYLETELHDWFWIIMTTYIKLIT